MKCIEMIIDDDDNNNDDRCDTDPYILVKMGMVIIACSDEPTPT